MVAPVSEGDIVLEKYRVERVLGKGGMGVVVAATHVELEHRVALKFLLPMALEHPDIVERFAREARVAAKIQSRHIARVIDTGRMPSGAPFMVMEYLEGQDLAELLKTEGRLAPDVAVDYVLQACEAIAEAHAAGVIHRDLKPSNLFLAKQRDRRAIVKVLDFGISKLVDPKELPLTRSASIMGSPHYMSPEQLTSSKNVDPRTDIWALGVILYELVAGRRPFDADTMPEIVAQVLQNTPTRLSFHRPNLALDFEHIIARCMATFPRDRYPSVREMAAALSAFAPDSNAATLAVARIGRVLGGPSLPPAAVNAVPLAPRIVIAETLASDGAETKVVEGGESSAPVTAPQAEAPSTASHISRAPLFVGLGGVILLAALAYAIVRGPGDGPAPAPAPAAIPESSVVAAPSVVPASPEPSAAVTSPSATSSTIALPPPRVTASVRHSSPPKSPAPSAVVPEPKKNPLDMGIK